MDVIFDNKQSYVVDQTKRLHQADTTLTTVGDTGADNNEINHDIMFTVTAQ
jgi:hypothetical protein